MPTKLHGEGASAEWAESQWLQTETAPATPLSRLAHDPAHITLAYATDVAGLARAAGDDLSEQELARAKTLSHAGRREEFLAGRGLLRALLQSAGPHRARDWRVCEGPHGRPVLADGGLEFNITHTHGLVACALSARGSLASTSKTSAVKAIGAPSRGAFLRPMRPRL